MLEKYESILSYAAQVLAAQGDGSIVVIASGASFQGSPGMTPYISSKHAVAGIAKSLALELATTGVNVNCVCPGPVDTEMMRDIESKALGDSVKTEDAVKQFAAGTPNGRYAKAEEVAALSVFLASPLVRHITGDLVNIDGGVAANGR